MTQQATFLPPSWVNYATITVEKSGTVYNTLTDWETTLTDGSVGDPTLRKHEVVVPGRDGVLDMSEALGGVYFEDRRIEFRLVCVNSTLDKFHALASTIRNAIDGKMCHITFSDDLGYYWRGRPTVDVTWDVPCSAVVVRADVEPYKYSVLTSYEPWLWSPFSFVNGVISQQSDVVLNNETKSVTLPKDPAKGKPTLWLNQGSAQAKLSDEAAWHTLANGANTFPEIRMSADSTLTLMLKGTGRVGVEYRLGSL